MAAVWKFKAIKPKKLNDKEIKREIRNAVFRVGRQVKRDFERTVETWEHKPKFSLTTSVRQDSEPGFLVGTDDEIYNWVNNGTPEHIYGPSTASQLYFQPDYTSKTEPDEIMSRSGGKSGAFVSAQIVINPGISPRNFDKILAAKYEKIWKRAIEDAIKAGIAASGHKV